MINIISYPKNFTPIYNDYIYVTQSDFYPILPSNYRAICDVYINDNKVGTLKSYVNKDGYNFFRLDRICQDYFTFDIHDKPSISTLWYVNDNSIKNIYGVFYEEYGDLSTGTTVYTGDSVTGDTIFAFNGAITLEGDMSSNYDTRYNGTNVRFPRNFTDWYGRTYTARSTIESLFMTYAPRTLKMSYCDTFYLNIMVSDDDVLSTVNICTYDNDGNLIVCKLIVNPNAILTPTGPTSETLLQTIGIGPLDINTASYTLYGSPLINSNVSYYTIQTYDSSGDTSSELFKVIIKDKKYYQKFRFRWLNSFGGFDSYTFEGRNNPTKNVRNSTEFTKLFGNEGDGEYLYPNGDRGRKSIYQSVETQYTVYSQFVSEAESYWLNELFTSPEVYLEVVQDEKPILTTYDWEGSGLLGIKYNTPHYYTNDSLICVVDCDDPGNNNYASVTYIDEYNIAVASSYVDIQNGFTFVIDEEIKLLPIMINSKTYNIKQSISPRNIQVQIDFTLALEDPKQRG